MAAAKSTLLNIQRRKYLESIKLLPRLQDQKTQAYISLALTFAALTIFGLFAINPTLGTIADLQSQLKERTQLHKDLQQKITNLDILQSKYNSLAPDLPVILAAVPVKPGTPYFLGQLQALAQGAGLTITSLQGFQVQLTLVKQDITQNSSYAFALQGEGTYDQISKFLEGFTSFDRIVTIENIIILRNTDNSQQTAGPLQLSIRGRTYFKP